MRMADVTALKVNLLLGVEDVVGRSSPLPGEPATPAPAPEEGVGGAEPSDDPAVDLRPNEMNGARLLEPGLSGAGEEGVTGFDPDARWRKERMPPATMDPRGESSAGLPAPPSFPPAGES